jgi:hypothetical protein
MLSILKRHGWTPPFLPKAFLTSSGELKKPKDLVNVMKLVKKIVTKFKHPRHFHTVQEALQQAAIFRSPDTSSEYLHYLVKTLGPIIDSPEEMA